LKECSPPVSFQRTASWLIIKHEWKCPELAGASAQFCATVTMLFNTLAGAFTQISKMSWVPQQGWMYAGGEFTVAIGGYRGVFVETAKADFNKLYKALVG